MPRRPGDLAERLRAAAAIEDEEREEKHEPDMSDATPLQVLENIAVNGKSETARVQALKVLLDRQHQLEQEREEKNERPTKCPECLEREKHWVPPDEVAARAIEELFELGVLIPQLIKDVTANAESSSRLGRWIREEVLADVQAVDAEVDRRVRQRFEALHSSS